MTNEIRTDAEQRTAAAARIDAAFERYNHRTQPTSEPLTYERQRADDATTVLCHLIGALEAVVGSEYIPLSPARVAECIEQSVGAVFGDAQELEHGAAPEPPAATPTLMHALTPLYGRVSRVGLEPRCGADGMTVVFASDVTCPRCLALMAAQDRGQR